MRTWTWANLLKCPPVNGAPSQTAPRTSLIDAAAAGLIAHPAKDPERSGPAPRPSAGRSAGCPAPTSGQRQPRRQRGEFRTRDRSRRLTTGIGPRDRRAPAMPSRPASTPPPGRDYVPFVEVARRKRCGSCPGTRWIRPGSPTCRPGWASCPPPRCAARPPAAGGRQGWQSRRTVGDRHLPGDHRFHQHLGDVGGVAAGEDDRRLRLHRSLRKAQHWPGPTLTLRRPDVGCRPTGTASSQ